MQQPEITMDPGLVSIMMPAYNAERYIGQAVESALVQSYSDWELIVVDDGSKDGTALIVGRYADTRIRLFHQQNAGEAAARNKALSVARGEFVAFLDADDIHLPHHLESTTGCLRQRPDLDGVYTNGYYIDLDGRRLKSLTSRRRGPYEGGVFDQAVRASDVFGPPTSVVLRREPILRHQLQFDTRIRIGPDWDFFIRYAESGQFGYIDDATCLYRVHPGSTTLETSREERMLSLALCREKAIRRPGFSRCCLETRVHVFYDLLVNLLAGHWRRQAEITAWPEFDALPAEEQARLLRLMASRAILEKDRAAHVRDWLIRARKLNPSDRKGAVLFKMFTLAPRLCRELLRARALIRPAAADSSPFADLRLPSDADSDIS